MRDIEKKLRINASCRDDSPEKDGTLFCQTHLPFTHRKDYPHGWYEKILIGALLGTTLLPALAIAAEAPAATFTPEQEARIGKIAADYLVAHPEVLLQASQKLQQIQQEQQASAATQAVIKTRLR